MFIEIKDVKVGMVLTSGGVVNKTHHTAKRATLWVGANNTELKFHYNTDTIEIQD